MRQSQVADDRKSWNVPHPVANELYPTHQILGCLKSVINRADREKLADVLMDGTPEAWICAHGCQVQWPRLTRAAVLSCLLFGALFFWVALAQAQSSADLCALAPSP